MADQKTNNTSIEETTRVFTKLSREERETIYTTDEVSNEWKAFTTITKDMNRLQKMGWILTKTKYYPDGSVYSMEFTAPRNCLAPRTYNPNKAKKTRAPLSEEQKQKMLAGRVKKDKN